jgi:hypothetical protein
MKIIITERQYRLLIETSDDINNIFNKMADVGFDNLSPIEKDMIQKYGEWLKTDQKKPFSYDKPKEVDTDTSLEGDLAHFERNKNLKISYSTTLSDGSTVKFLPTFKPRKFKDFTEYESEIEWDDQVWTGYVAVNDDGKIQTIEYGILKDENENSENYYEESNYISLKDEMGNLWDELKGWIEFEVVPGL